MNQPYVKRYDPNTGELLNPINGYYLSRASWKNNEGKTFALPNRRERRQMQLKSKRERYCNVIQQIVCSNGRIKTIFHNAAVIRQNRSL